MLETEAKWFGEVTTQLGASRISPILNIGSSTEEFRTVIQPWIDQHLWRPITQHGGRVVHMDIKNAPGVDIVGDLDNENLVNSLSQMKFNAIFCNNLLKHVADRARVCDTIRAILPDGGYICLSCPHRFPYHPDPIDTMFRPSIEELASLFPDASLLRGKVVHCNAHRRPLSLMYQVLRLCMPFYRPMRWIHMVRYNVGYLRQDFEATCLVLRKRIPPVGSTVPTAARGVLDPSSRE